MPRHIEQQILGEIRKVLSSLESNAKVARIREEELTAQLNALKAGSAREGEEAVELRSLEREAAAQRELLETYLSRYREAASRTEPKALRDAIEQTKGYVGVSGTYNITPEDHNGLALDSMVIVQVKDGKFVPAP